MASTSSRALQLLSLLQTHRSWAGTELADRLKVSLRTLRRDVDRLRELGYPVEGARGVDGGYRLAPGASLPPLVLDDDEAVALVVGLQGAASVTVAGVAESSVSALTKVVQVMPPRLRRRVDAVRTMTVEAAWSGTGPAVDPEALTAVAQACRDTERLHFSYVSAAGDPSDRDIEPHRLVRMGRRWYLVAYDLSRHDWRSFRLDRLQQPRSTGARFLPRTLPAQDAADFVRAGLAQLPTQFVAEAEFDAPAADVRARVGAWAEIEDAGPDRCRLRMRTDSLDWAAVALGVAAAPFQVLGPPELAEHVRAWAERFARATARATGG